MTNWVGNVVARERYSAFGERRRLDNAALTDQLYTGQRLNVLSGLYHYSDGTSAGRFYDPLLARFLQADSATPDVGSAGLNRFSYGYNNPVAYIDPDGHCAFDDNGNINRFDCTTEEFEALTAQQRIQWMQAFPRQIDYNGWFNNIVDIITYFSESASLRHLDRAAGRRGWMLAC